MVQLVLNNVEVKEGGRVQHGLLGAELNILWNTAPGKYYTLLLINPKKNSVYALVNNIPGANLDGGQIQYPLTTETEDRRHLPVAVHVYLQPNYQAFDASKHSRYNFNEAQFVAQHGLTLVDSLNFSLYLPPASEETKVTWMNPNPTLTGKMAKREVDTERLDKYCRCVLDVAAKNSQECLEQKAWGQEIGGRTCYNPYAVCAKTIGTTTGRSPYCGQNYNYNELPDKLLVAYARLNKIEVPEPYNRQTVLKNIQKFKETKA